MFAAEGQNPVYAKISIDIKPTLHLFGGLFIELALDRAAGHEAGARLQVIAFVRRVQHVSITSYLLEAEIKKIQHYH